MRSSTRRKTLRKQSSASTWANSSTGDGLIAHFIPNYSPACLQRASMIHSDPRPRPATAPEPRCRADSVCSSRCQGGRRAVLLNERGSAWERAGSRRSEAEQLRRAQDYSDCAKCCIRAARVTDKMPLNFQWAGLIHLALPRATLIHCRPSPLDTAHYRSIRPISTAHVVPTGGAALVGLCAGPIRGTNPNRVESVAKAPQLSQPRLVGMPAPDARR